MKFTHCRVPSCSWLKKGKRSGMSVSVAIARQAMATRFELILHGTDPIWLRAAGEEALDEVQRLEAQLSFYQPRSEISRLNARAHRKPVRVEPGLFRLLQRAQMLSRETEGAFDITVAPLMRCWGFIGGSGSRPDPAMLEEARSLAGSHLIEFNERDYTVRFAREGMKVDLGAIGKGYAVDRAIEVLLEAGVTSAFLHGGTSTAYGLGTPPHEDSWKVVLEIPEYKGDPVPDATWFQRADDSRLEEERVLAVIGLKDESLSVSAPTGKAFVMGGKILGHVIDPRTGAPVQGAEMAAVVHKSATETDAISTALLVLGIKGTEQVGKINPEMRILVVGRQEGHHELRMESKGIQLLNRG
jgi:FAD:protein FMN transferase